MALPALLFDLDGTLVDSARDISRALSALRLERGGSPIDPTEVRQLVSYGVETVVSRGLGDRFRDMATDLPAFRAALADLPPDPATIFPGVVDALIAFADAGYRMAIVTNKPEALSRRLLQGLALDSHFLAIVGGDTAPRPKPHGDPLNLALSSIGAGTDAAMMIGDSHIDAAAAEACGIPFLLYDAGYGAAACDAESVHGRFSHFDQLGALVSAWPNDAGRRSRSVSMGC